MSSILTNTSAMVALQTLQSINSSLNKTQSEISTGKTVASAKDNSATWAISKIMESDVMGFRAISESLSLGESTVAVARQASETITGLLTEIKGKIVAAQEENVDRGKIQTDIGNLRDQINSTVNAAQFNSLNLVRGTDAVNILSSLDRGADGSVTASSITVSRQDLTTAAAVAGTEESAELTATATADGLDGGNVATAATAALTVDSGVDSNEEAATFTITGTAPNDAAGTEATFSINGVTIDVTLGDEATDEQMATAIAAAFEDARDNGTGVTAEEQEALAGITVDRTGAALEFTSTDLAGAVELDFSDVDGVAGVGALSGGQTSVTLDASLVTYATEVTVGDATVAVNLTSGMTNEQVAAAVAAAVEDAGLEGVTVARDGAELTFTNASGAELEVDLSGLSDDGLGGANGVTFDGGTDSATIADNSVTVAFAGEEVELAGGDTFRITLGSGSGAQEFEYTLASTPPNTEAGRAAAFEQIAQGLAAEIEAADGLSASVNAEGELVVGNTGDDPLAYSFEAFTGGVGGGGLAALSEINVSTNAGASAALDSIEAMIQTAIDASAAFGSVQGRIEIQSEFVGKLTDSLRAGIGTLVDANMEEASARLQALQVQQQLGIQALSIANQAPQSILALFR